MKTILRLFFFLGTIHWERGGKGEREVGRPSPVLSYCSRCVLFFGADAFVARAIHANFSAQFP